MFNEYWDKMTGTLLAGILAGVIAIGAAILQWREKVKDDLETELNRERLERAQKAFADLQIQNLEETKKIVPRFRAG